VQQRHEQLFVFLRERNDPARGHLAAIAAGAQHVSGRERFTNTLRRVRGVILVLESPGGPLTSVMSPGLSDFIEDSYATRRGHQLELVRLGAAVKQ
jgi:hypothetical protein